MQLNSQKITKLTLKLLMSWLAIVVLGAMLTGCGGESESSLSKNALSLCKGQIDSDGDGLCDNLENDIGADANDPDQDKNGIVDGFQLSPIPGTNPSRAGGGSGSVGQISSGANPFMSVLASSILSPGAKGIQQLVDGATGLALDEDEEGRQDVTVVKNIEGKTPVAVDTGDKDRTALLERMYLKTLAGEPLDIKLDLGRSGLELVRIQDPTTCRDGANWALVTNVYLKLADKGFEAWQQSMHLVQLVKLADSADAPEVATVANTESYRYDMDERTPFIDAQTRRSGQAQTVITEILAGTYNSIKACAASGYYAYAPFLIENQHRYLVLDEQTFGYQESEDGIFRQFKQGAVSLAFPQVQLQPFLDGGSVKINDLENLRDMASYIDVQIPSRWCRKGSFLDALPWAASWRIPGNCS